MKSGRLARLVLAGAAWMAAGAGLAAELEAITVTASRTAALDSLGGSLVDARALERLSAPTALDALDRLAGVRAFAKGGAGGGSYLSVRGGEPNFTLVLLEGVRLNDPTNSAGGAFDFAQLDPALIARIDVARGGLSAVHGADALSGVVNLRLRRPAGDGVAAFGRALGSTQAEAGATAGVTLGGERLGLLAAGSGYRSGRLTEGSSLERAQALVRADGVADGVSWELLGLYGATAREAFPEDGGGPRLSVGRELARRDTDLKLASGALRGDLGPALSAGVRISASRQVDDAQTPAIAPGVLMGVPAISARSRFDRLEAVADLGGETGGWRWAAGAAFLAETGEGSGFVDFGVLIPADFRLSRQLWSGFAEASGDVAAGLSLTGGVRLDAPDGADARATGRGALRWTPGPEGWALRLGVAQGFKQPSLYALAYPLIANPDLRPELGRSIEAGLDAPLPGGKARLTLFDARYRDLIDFDAESFTNVNRARVTSRGVEMEARLRPAAAWLVEGAVTWLDVTSEDGPPLRSRPAWTASALAEWIPAPKWALWGQVQHVGRFNDLSVPTGPVVADARTTLDLGARWQALRGVAVEAGIHNLTGADYEEAVGFPAAGRLLRVALRFGV